MLSSNACILLIGEPSMHLSLLGKFLSEALSAQIRLTKSDDLRDTRLSNRQVIFMFDLATLQPDDVSLCKHFLNSCAVPNLHKVTLINAEEKITIDILLDWPLCHGIFFASDEPKQLNKGLKKILEGELWIPRHIMFQLFTLHQHRFHGPQEHRLTSREVEIMRHIQSGHSNYQIANSLFVSENTVKSHIYRIFKKIAVKNRSQAMKWANERLPINLKEQQRSSIKKIAH